jgi:hypothetical protein
MSVKATGAEIKAFMGDDNFWSQKGESWAEEVEFEVNGSVSYDLSLHTLNDNDQIKLVDGYVVMEQEEEPVSLATFFRRWRKTQTTAYLSVEVPKDKADIIKAAIKAAGGKVI